MTRLLLFCFIFSTILTYLVKAEVYKDDEDGWKDVREAGQDYADDGDTQTGGSIAISASDWMDYLNWSNKEN